MNSAKPVMFLLELPVVRYRESVMSSASGNAFTIFRRSEIRRSLDLPVRTAEILTCCERDIEGLRHDNVPKPNVVVVSDDLARSAEPHSAMTYLALAAADDRPHTAHSPLLAGAAVDIVGEGEDSVSRGLARILAGKSALACSHLARTLAAVIVGQLVLQPISLLSLMPWLDQRAELG